MSDTPEVCLRCGEPFITLPWSEETNLLICDNVKCGLFHTPVTAVPKSDRRAPSRRNAEFLSTAGGDNVPTDSSIKSRLQRMQEELYSEE